MAPPRWLMPHIARYQTSERVLNKKRKRQMRARIKSGARRRFVYVHRVDDPYSYLMVQSLMSIRHALDGDIVPLVVERLPADMYPDPARYEAYSILDAERLSEAFGLMMPQSHLVPDRLSVQMVSRYLARVEDGDTFLAEAFKLGRALWHRDQRTIHESCSVAEMDDSVIRENEARLRRMRQYQSGIVMFEGESYQGVDRLHHLVARLEQEGEEPLDHPLARRIDWRVRAGRADQLVGKSFDFFFSIRSPYSYLAIKEVQDFEAHTGARARWRPVLPMKMRGMQVPKDKARAILLDAAREARALGIPFGAISDPLGEPTERAMAHALAIKDRDRQIAFIDRYMTMVWAEGRLAHKEATFEEALLRAGVISGNDANSPANSLASSNEPRGSSAHTPLADIEWRNQAADNLADMLRSGAWGVPSFATRSGIIWGQDRLWSLFDTLVLE